MPANQSIRNAILPTHTEWTTTAIGSPLATPTNFAAVFTTKARLYMLRCLCTKALRNTLRCIRAKALRTLLRCLLPKHDSIRCGVSHQSSTTLYAEVSYTKALQRMLRLLRQGCENTLWCLHQSCGMPRCLLLASKPKSYGGVYWNSRAREATWSQVGREEQSLKASG